jgi:flagellar export protein FliJ
MPLPESRRLQGIRPLTKFVFTLETLLRHRKSLEEKERDALLRLTYQYQVEQDHREELSGKFKENMQQLSLMRSQNGDHKELNWFHLYLNRLTHEIGECEKRLSQLKREIQTQKEVVIEASKKRKTLTAMKAKKEKAYLRELEKQEQKEIDELVLTRYAAKDSGRTEAMKISKHE